MLLILVANSNTHRQLKNKNVVLPTIVAIFGAFLGGKVRVFEQKKVTYYIVVRDEPKEEDSLTKEELDRVLTNKTKRRNW